MVNIKTIEAFFVDYKFTKDALILSKHEKILDVKKYVETNIKILKSNSGKSVYSPYFYRLERVYKKIKNKDAK